MRDQAFGIMAAAARRSPGRVAALLRPRIDDSLFTPWIRDVARFTDLSDSRRFRARPGQCQARGMGWDGYEHGLWMYADDIAERPEWGAGLLASYLVDRPDTLEVEDGKISAISRREHRVGLLVSAAAPGAPRQFWGRSAIGCCAMAATSDPDGDRPLRDRHFGFRRWPPAAGVLRKADPPLEGGGQPTMSGVHRSL